MCSVKLQKIKCDLFLKVKYVKMAPTVTKKYIKNSQSVSYLWQQQQNEDSVMTTTRL